MKINILFIIPSLGIGGGEKSLVNLLNQIDYTKYNVDLFLIDKEGLFIKFVPEEVNILDIPGNLENFKLPIYKSINKFLAQGKFLLAYSRLMFFINNRIAKNKSKGEQYSWKNMSGAIGKLENSYDVAIGYLEKTSNYICVDCVDAKRKIGWMHTDYNKLDADVDFDNEFINKLDYMVTVSEECSEVLASKFDNMSNKVKIIENIVSPQIINKMSQEEVDIDKKEYEKLIVSVGRLSHEKGFDIAIKACKIIKDKGLNIKWYVIGEGSERPKLEKLIQKNKLGNIFILKGLDNNPYRYLAKADIYVQPSRFEGKSIAMDEAKILNKAIVATNFTTVKDQITNGVNGIITDMNEESLAKGVQLLLEDNNLRNKIELNLKETDLGNENEINKLYDLFK